MSQIILLVVIFVLLIFILKQTLTFKKSFGVYKNIDFVIEETKRKKLESLEREIENCKFEKISKLDNEIERQQIKIQEMFEAERKQIVESNQKRLEILNEEYDNRRKNLEEDFISLKMQQENKKNDLQLKIEQEIKEMEEDKAIISSALDDLKVKQSKTIETLKNKSREKDKLSFHQVKLSDNELSDIEELKKVEKLIHNKNVLRKLIYKTYIETPMNELFNRLGITTDPGIYKIENIKDGKVYIGQSANVRNRLREHLKSAVGISNIAQQGVHEAMSNEGIQHFTFHLIDECERAKLNDREKYWIEFYQSNEWGYNRTRGGS